MSDSTTTIDQILESQEGKEDTANELFDAASPAMYYGRRASTCSGLTWGYYGAKFGSGASSTTTIANGTQLLTASTTTYMEYDTSTGAVSFNTTGWTGGSKKPAYKIVTGSSAVNSYEDCRNPWF